MTVLFTPRRCAVAMGLTASLLAPLDAVAVTVQQVVGDSFAGGIAATTFPSFDPALGTLQRVDVAITGVLLVEGFSQPNFISTPGGAVPVPLGLSAGVSQNAIRVGIGDRGFEFASPAIFTLSGLASGAGEPVTLQQAFSYDFAFTAASDIIGFVFPSFSGPNVPPTSIVGLREDFVDLAPPLPDLPIEIDFLTFLSSSTGLAAATVASNGSLTVTYTYRLAEPPPAAITEPGALAVMIAAFAGLLILRRRPMR